LLANVEKGIPGEIARSYSVRTLDDFPINDVKEAPANALPR